MELGVRVNILSMVGHEGLAGGLSTLQRCGRGAGLLWARSGVGANTQVRGVVLHPTTSGEDRLDVGGAVAGRLTAAAVGKLLRVHVGTADADANVVTEVVATVLAVLFVGEVAGVTMVARGFALDIGGGARVALAVVHTFRGRVSAEVGNMWGEGAKAVVPLPGGNRRIVHGRCVCLIVGRECVVLTVVHSSAVGFWERAVGIGAVLESHGTGGVG